MKSLILSIFFCIITCFVAKANPAEFASEFYVNDQLIEATLQSSTTHLQLMNVDISNSSEISDILLEKSPTTSQATIAPKDEKLVSILLCFFFGGIAIHRVYLGSTPLMILYYFITCSGICGIVPFIDFIMLIVNGTDSYTDSDKFFSW